MKPIYKALLATLIGIVSIITLLVLLICWDFTVSKNDYDECVKDWLNSGATIEEARAQCDFFLE